MSLLRRVSRAMETLSRPQLNNRSLFGALGEEYASQFLEGPLILSRVMNPIIPASNGRRYPLEADFLVYTQGNLFCIEIKRYKGTISYVPRQRKNPSPGWERSDDPQNTRQSGLQGHNDRELLQEKVGKYGDVLSSRTYPNPLKKTKTFIWSLKDYLGKLLKTV